LTALKIIKEVSTFPKISSRCLFNIFDDFWGKAYVIDSGAVVVWYRLWADILATKLFDLLPCLHKLWVLVLFVIMILNCYFWVGVDPDKCVGIKFLFIVSFFLKMLECFVYGESL
jgi:hypothetical protein